MLKAVSGFFPTVTVQITVLSNAISRLDTGKSLFDGILPWIIWLSMHSFIFHCSLYNNIRDQFLQHVSNTIFNINEKNEIDKIRMFMSKEVIGYLPK